MWPLASLTGLSRLTLGSTHNPPDDADAAWAEQSVADISSILAQLRGLTCLV